MFQIRIRAELCKGCGFCVAACARGILAMSKRLSRQGYHVAEVHESSTCVGCRLCSDVCPEAAVEIDQRDPDSPEAAGARTGQTASSDAYPIPKEDT
jgi:2-oxoglutarate ferredoxin oxidoreductase subunit delta